MKKEMDSNIISLSKAALIAGTSLIIMTILAIIFLLNLQATFYSIIGISIIIILDIIVALLLYFLLKPVNKNISLSMSLFRVIYAIIFTIALYNIYNLTTFYSIWDIGTVFFGIHLFLLGILVIKSEYIPKWLGILIIIASLGYITDSVVKFLGYSFEIGMFTFFGEVLFALWLVIKGRKISHNKSIS